MQFSDLGVSTITVMVYTNILMDLQKLFDNMVIYEVVDPPLTKKKKMPNVKKINAPYGQVLSLRIKKDFRGLVTKPPSDTYFLNQMTCILSLGNYKNVNIFIFNTSLKVVGCKNESEVEEVLMILWEEYIKPLKDCYATMDDEKPNFTFETVMTNTDFLLGFKIDRKRLNTLLNSKEYQDRIRKSKFETTGDTNVKIQFKTEKPEGYFYWRFTEDDGVWSRDKVDNILYKKAKKKKKSTTFLVFHSSKTIVSGRYYENMSKDYEYFLNIVNKNRSLIEEKIDTKFDKFVF